TDLSVDSLLNNAGTFTPAGFFAGNVPFFSPVNPTISSTVADLDRDGIDDLAVAVTSSFSTNSKLYFFKGDGTDGGLTSFGPFPIRGQNPSGLTTGDYNGDAWPDLAVVTSAGLTIELNSRIPGDPFPVFVPPPHSRPARAPGP